MPTLNQDQLRGLHPGGKEDLFSRGKGKKYAEEMLFPGIRDRLQGGLVLRRPARGGKNPFVVHWG